MSRIKTGQETLEAAQAEVCHLLKDHWEKIEGSIRNNEENADDDKAPSFHIGMSLDLEATSQDSMDVTVVTAGISYLFGMRIKDETEGARVDDHPKLGKIDEEAKKGGRKKRGRPKKAK